jgi:methylisocitrate lyase
VSIPVIADVDTGFGASENVRRTVREFELVGIAGVQIEDQASPKKCGLLAGKECVAPEEMAEKVAVAVDARRDPDTLIVARTDALETYGLENVLSRGKVYFEAGADVLFVEGLRTEEEAESVGAAFAGRHLIFNRTPRGYSPAVPIATLHGWGFNLVIFPMQLVLAAVTVMNEALAQIAETGACDALEDRMMDIEAFFAIAERRTAAKQA